METIKKPHGFENEKLIVLPRDFISQNIKNPLIKDLHVTDVGFFPNAKYHYRERNEGSEQYILIVNLKGNGFVKMHNKNHLIKENTIVLIPKNIAHIYGSSEQNPWEIYWIHFNGSKAKYYLPQYNTKDILIKTLTIDQLAKILPLFTSIIDTLEYNMTINNVIHASTLLSQLLSYLFIYSDISIESTDKKTVYFVQVLEYLNKELHKHISLDDIASHINLSKSQLNLIFKEKTGLSPVQFFIRLKIQKACRLLNLTDLQINEIAIKVGYEDPYFFTRIFRKIMGVSPSQYRNNKSM